jgi:membrane protein DedA with SNARE-associated domain
MREWLSHNDVWGVAVLMFLQNIFPLIPSEVIMPLAGFLASIGILDMKGVVIAGLIGSMLGHLPWYFLGFALGERRVEAFAARYGHWVRLNIDHVRKAGNWFDRNSIKAVLLGRLVPGVRTYVNIPAGTMRMPFLPYLLFTFIGDAVWTTLLAYGGYALGRDYHLIASYIHMLIWIFAIGAALITAWIYIRHHRQHSRTV